MASKIASEYILRVVTSVDRPELRDASYAVRSKRHPAYEEALVREILFADRKTAQASISYYLRGEEDFASEYVSGLFLTCRKTGSDRRRSVSSIVRRRLEDGSVALRAA